MPEIVEPKQLIQSRVLVKRARRTSNLLCISRVWSSPVHPSTWGPGFTGSKNSTDRKISPSFNQCQEPMVDKTCLSGLHSNGYIAFHRASSASLLVQHVSAHGKLQQLHSSRELLLKPASKPQSHS